jgi:hypothetical protein
MARVRARIPPIAEDTTSRADEVQIALLRRASVARRLHLAFGLSATAIGMAKRAIARAHPAASRDELDLLFVEVHYGRDLARDLRLDLERRRASTRPR